LQLEVLAVAASGLLGMRRGDGRTLRTALRLLAALRLQRRGVPADDIVKIVGVADEATSR
jgi:hypothetical protein